MWRICRYKQLLTEIAHKTGTRRYCYTDTIRGQSYNHLGWWPAVSYKKCKKRKKRAFLHRRKRRREGRALVTNVIFHVGWGGTLTRMERDTRFPPAHFHFTTPYFETYYRQRQCLTKNRHFIQYTTIAYFLRPKYEMLCFFEFQFYTFSCHNSNYFDSSSGILTQILG